MCPQRRGTILPLAKTLKQHTQVACSPVLGQATLKVCAATMDCKACYIPVTERIEIIGWVEHSSANLFLGTHYIIIEREAHFAVVVLEIICLCNVALATCVPSLQFCTYHLKQLCSSDL